MTDPKPLSSPWEEVNRVMQEADKIEALASLYRDGGRTHAEALEMAIAAWKANQPQPVPAP